MSELKPDDTCSLEDHFYGSVTVGERGQVVIPAEARKKLGLNPGDKLLVMGHPFATGIVLAKIESVREFISAFTAGLRGAEEVPHQNNNDH